MSLPPELLDELVAILRSVVAHEALASDGVRLSEEALASIAGNAVQVMSEPLERYGRAVMISTARGMQDAGLRPVATEEVYVGRPAGWMRRER